MLPVLQAQPQPAGCQFWSWQIDAASRAHCKRKRKRKTETGLVWMCEGQRKATWQQRNWQKKNWSQALSVQSQLLKAKLSGEAALNQQICRILFAIVQNKKHVICYSLLRTRLRPLCLCSSSFVPGYVSRFDSGQPPGQRQSFGWIEPFTSLNVFPQSFGHKSLCRRYSQSQPQPELGRGCGHRNLTRSQTKA